MHKKGFTLMEIMIVVLIIGILFTMYSLSYNSTKINRKNEKAVAMFVEFANAARLYNEMFPTQRVVGKFGSTIISSDACSGCVEPCRLFIGSNNNADVQEYLQSFGLRPIEWSLDNALNCGTNFNYEGYTFTLCNPASLDDDEAVVAQPGACNGLNAFAVMDVPSNPSKYGKYAGKKVWITKGYEIANNLNTNSD